MGCGTSQLGGSMRGQRSGSECHLHPPAPSAPAGDGQTAQTCGVARDVDGGPGRVEVSEVSEDDGFIARFFHLFEGRVERRPRPVAFIMSDAAVGTWCRRLTDGGLHFIFHRWFLQHGRRWRFYGEGRGGLGTLEVTGNAPTRGRANTCGQCCVAPSVENNYGRFRAAH